MVRELRIPVPTPLTMREAEWQPEPYSEGPEYFVLEHDVERGIVRHPTTGRIVAADVYFLTPYHAFYTAWLRGLID